MIKLSQALAEEDLARFYSKQKGQLPQGIENAAWDGNWYLRGRFDDGRPLGSVERDEAQIDSFPQSWAWLSGAADPARAETALESASQCLVLIYRAWVEKILGLKRRGDVLIIDSVIPPTWNGFSVTCRFNSAEYVIVITNPDRVGNGVFSLELDGKPIRGTRIPLEKEEKQKVNVRMGNHG